VTRRIRLRVTEGNGSKINPDDQIAVARRELHWARHSVSSSYRMRMLGDLLPGNGPEKTAARVIAAGQLLDRAEAEWIRVSGLPLPEQDDCMFCPQSRVIVAMVRGKSS
jgi:hypothetical protein